MSNRPRETLINHRRIQWISVFSEQSAQGSIEIRCDAQSAFIVNALGKNHVGARHRRKPLGRRKGFNIFINAAFTKIRAFVCGQVLSNYFYYYMSYQKLGFCMRCTNFVQIFQLLRIYQKQGFCMYSTNLVKIFLLLQL